MTTIAWDGKTLAGDRLESAGGTPVPTRKVFRVSRDGRRVLFGGSGDWDVCVQWRRWMEGGAIPPEGDHHKTCVMIIDEKHRVWVADGRRIYTRINHPYWAIGSGADYALAAMHCGRTAAQAVRLASKLDINSGIGVDCVRFR